MGKLQVTGFIRAWMKKPPIGYHAHGKITSDWSHQSLDEGTFPYGIMHMGKLPVTGVIRAWMKEPCLRVSYIWVLTYT